MSLSMQPWSCLLPGDARFTFRGAPSWFDEHSEPNADVLVAWRPEAAELRDVARYRAVALFDPRRVRPRDLRDVGLPHLQRFAILPSLKRGRWLIPLEGPAVAYGAINALCTPYRLSGRVLARGARAFAAIGLPFARHHLWLASREPPWLETLFGGLLGRDDVRVGVASGGWGVRLTPTVAAFDPSGHVLAFAKLAGTPRSERLIRHEAEILGRLAERYPSDPIAPALLFAGEREGTYLLAQTVLAGKQVATGLSPAHIAFLRTLSNGERRPASATAFFRSLDERIGPLPELRRLLTRARAVLDQLVVPSTITHGDFAPYNLRRANGRIAAFDWENATLDGLPLIDLVHHELQVGFLLKDWNVQRTFDALRRIAANSRMPRPEALALEAAYLADMHLRRLDGGGRPPAPYYRQLLERVDRLLDDDER
jgi:hypothetical protein